jgi:hypothetical protein
MGGRDRRLLPTASADKDRALARLRERRSDFIGPTILSVTGGSLSCPKTAAVSTGIQLKDAIKGSDSEARRRQQGRAARN